MALSVNARAGLFLDGVQVAGQDLRLQLAAAFLTNIGTNPLSGIVARQGVRHGSGPGAAGPLRVQASSGMSVTVNSGICFIQGTASTTAGIYTVCLDTVATLTLTTSSATNPRIDLIAAVVSDVGSSSSTSTVQVITGVAASSPVAPPLPANALLLATIAVAANASTIVAGNITDGRIYTVATGGILPYADTSAGGISGPSGQYLHDQLTGRLRALDGGGHAIAAKAAAFAPVSVQPGPTVTVPTGAGYTTLASLSITTDGSEMEMYASWTSLTSTSGVAVGQYAALALEVDGVAISGSQPFASRADSTSLSLGLAGSIRQWMTPSAGAHTVTLVGQAIGNNFTMVYPYLRAMAAPQ